MLLIIVIFSYPERQRDWPNDARQPEREDNIFQGANSYKLLSLEDKKV